MALPAPAARPLEMAVVSDLRASRDTRRMPGSAKTPGPVMAWVDGVGGFLLLPGDCWSVGGPGAADPADVVVMGDLSRRAAAISADGEDYLLQPLGGGVRVGTAEMDRPVLLSLPSRIGLGASVELQLSRPHPLSRSARLELASRHRIAPACDGVILMSDTCILGPSAAAHIRCPRWSDSLTLFYSHKGWQVRSGSPVSIAGRSARAGRAELPPGSRLEGADFAVTLEPVEGSVGGHRQSLGG